jgi:NAD(P)-dependent dehydrogenase (short-subunit alcohol dehydrogenase family)
MSALKGMLDMQGRRALITGATGSLGCVIADTLAELGANLVLVDRPGADFTVLSENLSRHVGVVVESISCDLEDPGARDEMVRQVLKNGLELNVLINNAAFVGTSDLEGWATTFERQSVETWRRALEVNLTAVFDLCKQFAGPMRNADQASIINVGSIYGVLGPNWGLYEGTMMANPAAYAASKGGLVQLTRWLATTLAPHIRVNCISLGGIFRQQPEVFVRRYEAQTPLGRMATEDDFRGAFAYLASNLSQYVTGHDLLVDGGWSAW